MSCFVIAEAGVNHNGSPEIALRLVEIAAQCGANAVKFQTFRAEQLASAAARKAAYQECTTGGGSQLEMLRRLELPEKLHVELAQRCRELGIEFMSTAFDIDSARFLCQLGIRRIKVPSGELTNHPFLQQLAALGLPMIMSTGMSTLEEVRDAVRIMENARIHSGLPAFRDSELTLLHCTSNYPAGIDDANLLTMHTLRRAFGYPVGYSDHTTGIRVAPLAVAMGATVIEKHFTVDRTLAGPDHSASLEPEELAQMIAAVRETERALGSSEKRPTAGELPVRNLVRRSVTLRKPVKAGQCIERDNLALLRPGNGILPADLPGVIGRYARRDLPAGHTLQWSDLEE